MKHTLSVLVENRAGVLSKITALFARRGFNIDSLAVGTTINPDVSCITIVVDDKDNTVEQIEKDTNRDNFLTADQACAYGLIDKVITKREH